MIDSVMRVRIYNFLIVIGIALFANACQSQDELIQTSIQDGNTVLSVDDMEIISTGGSFSVAFTSNSSWKLKGRPGWLEVTKSSGRAGTTTIKMSAGCNDTRQDREAKLIFEAQDGSFSTPMKVRQTYPYLKIDVDTLSFNWNDCRTEQDGVVTDNNPQRIIISSNVDWRIEANPSTKADIVDFSHFTLSSEIGKGNDTLDIIPIKYNYSKEPYDIKLRLFPFVRDDKGNEIEIPATAANSYSLKLHQKNLRFLINDSSDDAEVEFHELKEDNDSTLIIDSEIKWSVAECPDWVEMKNKEGQDIKEGKDTVSVIFRANEANPKCEKREGTIKLTTGAGAYRDIAVSQRAYVFDIATDTLNIANDDVQGKTITLNTTGTWIITDIPEWLNVDPTEGSDTTDITINAKSQNLKFEDNTHTISIKSKLNECSEFVPITQKQFIFTVTPPSVLEKLENLPAMNKGEYKVTIESSGEWEIRDKPTWIDISPESPYKKGKTEVTIRPNEGNLNLDEARPAFLSLVSINHEKAGLTKIDTIKVTQRKFTFDVSESSFGTLAAYKQDSIIATVECSSGWKITCPPWVKSSIESGNGENIDTIKFKIQDNLDKTPLGREDDIVITSDAINEKRSIHVSQDAFVFDIDDKPVDNVPVINAGDYYISFELSRNAPWKITCDEWLNPSDTSGTGSATLTFSPSDNLGFSKRTGQALIYSEANKESKTITFTQDEFVFDSTSEEFSYTELDKKRNEIKITSSGPWTIQDRPSWMHVSSEKGDSTDNITVWPTNNTGLSPREDSFHIVSTLNDTLSKSITVKQQAFKFDTSPESFSYTTLEERKDTFNVLSSGSWTAKNIPAWLSLSKTSGSGSESGSTESITVTSTKNLTDTIRVGTIQIVSDDNNKHIKKVQVKQDKFIFDVDKREHRFNYPIAADNPALTVIVNCSAGWTVSNDSDWIIPSLTGGTGNASFNITPTTNTKTSRRQGKITITSNMNDLTKEIAISQEPFVFDTTTSVIEFAACDTSSRNVDVACSGEWTISNTESSWLSASQSVSKGDGSVTLTAQNNPDVTTRNAIVTITATDNPDLVKTIKVSQSKFVFSLSESSKDIAANFTAPITATVTCSTSWSAVSDAEWLTVSTDGSALIMTPTENTGMERTAIVTVSNPLNLTKLTYTIKQFGIETGE